ncbi:unnamed protein product [Spirodela intermedia]|uniref:Uncharacterized protein n=1 Tax=Spirodela intermedia TaxID=51605 RepID=A0A7I8LCI6_SPIIN|nr:unnamed protein product [Spirodela intermedia]
MEREKGAEREGVSERARERESEKERMRGTWQRREREERGFRREREKGGSVGERERMRKKMRGYDHRTKSMTSKALSLDMDNLDIC